MKRILITIILLAMLCLAVPASATDYYVSPTGSGSQYTIANPGHLNDVNAVVSAGDNVYLFNGTYDDATAIAIAPETSGNATHYITYDAYNGTPTLTYRGKLESATSRRGSIYLVSVSYINIKNITVYEPYGGYALLNNSMYLKFYNCTFQNCWSDDTRPLYIYNSSQVSFIDCWISGDDIGANYLDLVRTADCADHLLFLRTYFGNATHNCFMDTDGGDYRERFVVFRDCIIENRFHTGLFFSSGGDSRFLVDNCTFKNMGALPNPNNLNDRGSDPALYHAAQYTIIRNSLFYNNSNHWATRTSSPFKNFTGNWVYHNTMYNAKEFNYTTKDDLYYTGSSWFIGCQNGTIDDYMFDNTIINNIVWKSEAVNQVSFNYLYDPADPYDNYVAYNIIGDPVNETGICWRDAQTTNGENITEAEANNADWIAGTNSDDDPLFTDVTTYDFILQSASTAIDNGTWLTNITSGTAGGQTSFTVEDATPFYSGAGAPWLIEGEVGDTIKTEGGKETVIQSLNYTTDTLTVSPAIDIVNGEGLALSYEGTAPDIGAFEYDAGNAAPNITSWANNDTDDNTLSITVDALQQVNFNATANQTITTWTWKKDAVDQSHNYDNITLNWSSLGSKSVTVTAANTNGTSSAIEWSVTVEQIGTFNYYKEILINHSMVYEDLANFSVLINFTDSDLADHAQADGDDIIFRASDKITQLDHEQEYWNKTTGDYVGWVRVPAVNSTINTTIYMYYNNSDTVNSEDAAGVWDSHYKAVYHMSETPPGTVYDSTSNDNDGTTSGMDSADQVTGQIDGALDFDEVDDYVYTGVDTSLDVGNNITITIYAERHDALLTGLQSLVVYREANTDSQYTFYYNADERLEFWIHNGSWQGFTGTTQVQDTNPRRVDLVWNGTYAWTYINGAQDNAGAFAHTPSNAVETLWIGNDSCVVDREFDGILDECRISDTPRSAGWISTGYNTTKYPELFLIVGAEQSEGAADTKFEYWDSAAWIEDDAEYYLWFECFWITSGYPDGVAPNAEQTGSQHTLKITNNGTVAGTPKMKFNESTPAEVTVYVDDDHTVAGAVSITDTYQAVGASLPAGENVTLSAWVNLTGLTTAWEYEVYATVE